jgi:hypothetical protein
MGKGTKKKSKGSSQLVPQKLKRFPNQHISKRMTKTPFSV